ncbi:MAG: hypothetical protein ACQETE_01710 [Bacteroidota bacterium]
MGNIFKQLKVAKRLNGHSYKKIAAIHAAETHRDKPLSDTSIINTAQGQSTLKELHKWLESYIDQTRERYPGPFDDQLSPKAVTG